MAVKSDSYANQAGTGAPSFPFGLIGGSSQKAQFDNYTNAAGTGTPFFNFGLACLPGTVLLADVILNAAGNGPFKATKGIWYPNAINAVSADYTVLDSDGYSYILVTTGATDRTMTLPAPANNAGRVITFMKVDAGSTVTSNNGTTNSLSTSSNAGSNYRVRIVPNTGTIEGASINLLISQYSWVTLMCDGTNWWVLGAQDVIWQSVTSITVASAGNVYADVGQALGTPPGEWDMACGVRADRGGSTATVYLASFMGTTTGNNGTNIATNSAFTGQWDLNTGVVATTWTTMAASMPTARMATSSFVSVFPKVLYNTSVNTSQFQFSGYSQLRRVR